MSINFNMDVLVVDDYKTMVRIIINLLREIGFKNMDEAADGSSALALMAQKEYGLVISDWNMEPMSGLQLLKEVRANPSFKKIPFIMVTAEVKLENVVAAKNAGVSNYIVKPFSADTLRQKISAVLVPAA